jgi:anti-sigma-K factor RskA
MTDRELQEWEQLSRSITEADRARHAPPPMVWENIAATIAADAVSENPAPSSMSTTIPARDEIVPPEDIIDLSAAREGRAPAAQRQRRRYLVLAGAASVLVFLLGLSFLTGDTDEEPVLFAAEVSNATLPEPFEGTASAVIAGPDATVLEINFSGALPSDEPVELWLIKDDLSDMRSLGIVNAEAESWIGDWPTDLDPAEYSLVDLSIEPNDGDPTHSGRSILRGQLAAT